MAVIGELEVKTVVNNKEAERGLKELKRKLENEEKELEKSLQIKAKIEEEDLAPYKEEKEWLQERKNLIDESVKSEEMRKADYAMLQNDLDKLNQQYSTQIEHHKEITSQIEQQKINIEKYKDAIEDVESQVRKSEFAEIFKKQTKEIGKSIKQITRMGLAIFGIRGAYMMVRNAINVITQDDAQLKADIDYMKNAITYTLEPVVRWIVDLVKQIMYAVQNIAYFITGKNIFANASKHLSKAAGSAKQIRKQLAGFDEMNILSNSTGGGGSGATTPSVDLSKINELSTQGQGIIGIILGIAGALSALKFSELLKNLGLVSSALSFAKALGIGFILTGLYYLIKDIKDIWDKFDTSIKDNGTTIKDWGKIVADVGIIIGGIALLIGAWPVAVAAAIALIIGLLMQNWDKIKKWFTEKVFGWMDRMIENLSKTTFGNFIADIIRDSKRAITEMLGIFDQLFNGLKTIFDGILKVFKGDMSGFVDVGKGTINALISSLNVMISGTNTMLAPLREVIAEIGKISGKNWSISKVKIPLIPKLAKGGIVNQPGRGIPYRGATIAERGAEAIVPLTDSQQMQLLGESIGRYITVMNTNPIYMNGRLIAKEINRSNAEDDFAFNR